MQDYASCGTMKDERTPRISEGNSARGSSRLLVRQKMQPGKLELCRDRIY